MEGSRVEGSLTQVSRRRRGIETTTDGCLSPVSQWDGMDGEIRGWEGKELLLSSKIDSLSCWEGDAALGEGERDSQTRLGLGMPDCSGLLALRRWKGGIK